MQVIFNKGFDVSSILKKQHSSFLGSSFLAGLLFLTFSLNAYSDDLFIPLIDKADRARVEFNELYKYFLEQDPEVFKDSSEKLSENFKLKPNLTGRILDNGPVLLNLIEWLDKNKKNDIAGLLLLRKLNRFLYLEFRHFVGHLNVNKKYEGRLVGLLHNFYKFKVPAKVGSVEEKLKYEFPFQATISKAMLFILIVNASSLNYDEKVENVAYFLDKIRRELLEIKSHYSDGCNIRTADVNDFVELLQTYAAKEPLLGPNYLKRILIISMIIGVIALAVWIIWIKREEVKKGAESIGNGIIDFVSHGFRRIVRIAGEEMINQDNARVLANAAAEAVRNQVHEESKSLFADIEIRADRLADKVFEKAQARLDGSIQRTADLSHEILADAQKKADDLIDKKLLAAGSMLDQKIDSVGQKIDSAKANVGLLGSLFVGKPKPASK